MEKWTPEREERSRHASHAFGRGSSVWMRMLPQSVDDVFAPGRASLEWSIILQRADDSPADARRRRRLLRIALPPAEGSRWLAALIAAIWSAFLGVIFRSVGGLPIIP